MTAKTARILVIGLVGLLTAALGAHAADVRIGIIDTEQLLRDSKAAKDARGIFLMELETKRAQLNAKQGEVQARERSLAARAAGLPPAERKDEREALAQEVKELRRLKADLDEELKRRDRELTRELLTEIRRVVDDYAKKKKISVVLEKKSVVAFDTAVDITADVLEAYDVSKK